MSSERQLSASIRHSRMYRATVSGSVTSSIWQVDDEVGGCSYHFNLFRMPAETGRVSQLFQPEDLVSLLKVCRELAQVLAEAPHTDAHLSHDLALMAERLAILLRAEH